MDFSIFTEVSVHINMSFQRSSVLEFLSHFIIFVYIIRVCKRRVLTKPLVQRRIPPAWPTVVLYVLHHPVIRWASVMDLRLCAAMAFLASAVLAPVNCATANDCFKMLLNIVKKLTTYVVSCQILSHDWIRVCRVKYYNLFPFFTSLNYFITVKHW